MRKTNSMVVTATLLLLLPLHFVFIDAYTVYERQPDGNKIRVEKAELHNNPEYGSLPFAALEQQLDSNIVDYSPVSLSSTNNALEHHNKQQIHHSLETATEDSSKLAALNLVSHKKKETARKLSKTHKIVRIPARTVFNSHDIGVAQPTVVSPSTPNSPKDMDNVWLKALKEILVEFKKKMRNSDGFQPSFVNSNSVESTLTKEFRRRKPTVQLMENDRLANRKITFLPSRFEDN